MSVTLSPPMILQFQNPNNSGAPAAGFKLFTYQAGTSIKQSTWTDATQTVTQANPIILDSNGAATVWGDPTLAYKFVFCPPNDTDPPTSPIRTVDQIYFPITFNSGVALQSYPRTPGEISAGVTPLNLGILPYTPERYANNTTPGTTDMWPAIQAANNAAAAAGASVIFTPGVTYGVNPTANNGALVMTTSWICDGPRATLIRLDYTSALPNPVYFMVTAIGVNHLTLQGLVFDGQVTTVAAGQTPNVDLAAVGSYNDTSTEALWTQMYGVIFRSTQYCVIEDCHFKNFLRAGFRLDTGGPGGAVGPPVTPPIPPYATGAAGDLSLGNIVHNCKVFRTRGVFGDGFNAIDTESTRWSNCYVFDYQRIGFCTDVTTVGEMGMEYVNCTAEYGHDAVTSFQQSNAGFWIESGDGVSFVNCESKSTSVGFELASSASPAAGVWRPYTGSISATGCKAVRCFSSGFKINMGQRDTHVALLGCFAEVNSTAATYSGSVGVGANAYQVSFIPASGGTNSTSNVSCHVEIRGCRADMVAMSSTSTAAAFNCFNGAVTNGRQLAITIDGLSTKWLNSSGADDTAAITTYESTTAPNFGYFGDIVFSGANNGGTRFGGFAKVLNCVNETVGNVMLSSEFGNGNAVMEITNTRVSLRTGGATSNLGSLLISNCDLVDYRGSVGFQNVSIVNSNIADMDAAHKDRSQWSTGGATFFQITNCNISRNFQISSGQGASSSHYPTTSVFTGCVWNMKYQTESGLTIVKPGGDFASLVMNGCTFIDTGSTSTTNAFIFVNSSDTNFLVAGAGNVFDQNLISVAAGHVIKVNATNYDAPQTASLIYNTVFGTATIPLS